MTTHFCVERSLREDELVILAVFLLHMTVAEHTGVALGRVVAYKLLFTLVDNHPVGSLNGCSSTGTLFLSLHFYVETGVVYSHAVIFEDKLSEVERESVSIVKRECLLA